MNFSTAEKCLATLRAGDSVEFQRGENRVKVTRAANCFPPLDDAEAKKIGMKINVNWGELMVLLKQAFRVMMTAFRANQYFFTVKLPDAPDNVQADWESFITKTINSPIRKSRKYYELQRSIWSSTVTHGVGPRFWQHKDGWCPRFVPMCDLRVPTDTTTDFENLEWFAIRRMYTPLKLMEEVFDGNPNNKWDKKAVVGILKNYKELNSVCATNNYDLETSPEKVLEVIKQNGGYWDGDAVPAIPFWHFYFEDFVKPDDLANKETGIFMVVVPETGAVKSEAVVDKFLWKSGTPVAKEISEVLHCQFGDLSNDPPFKYQAIRGLGFVLLEPTFYNNILLCRWVQHGNDQLNIWLRSTDPAGKARAQVQEFSNLGVVPPGLSVVPNNERHQVDPNLIEGLMARMKQLMQDGAASYTQDIDSGTKKEKTAFETRVQLEQVSAMMSGILDAAFIYEGFAYVEMARRFCKKDSKDKDILKFQQKCREHGIPDEWIDSLRWEVEPVTPLGMGNPTVAQAAQQQLMQLKPQLSPKAQQEVLHDSVLVITGDPRKAARLAPMEGNEGTNKGAMFGMSIIGTLMEGITLNPPDGISPIEQLDVMIPLYAGKIAMMERRDNMADFGEGAGLQELEKYLAALVERLAQDPQQKPRVKQYSDALGKLGNQTKALIQRGVAHQQSQIDEAQKADMAKTNGELQIKAFKTKSDLALKKQKQDHTIALKNQQAVADNERANAKVVSETGREHFKTLHGAHMAREKQSFNGED